MVCTLLPKSRRCADGVLIAAVALQWHGHRRESIGVALPLSLGASSSGENGHIPRAAYCAQSIPTSERRVALWSPHVPFAAAARVGSGVASVPVVFASGSEQFFARRALVVDSRALLLTWPHAAWCSWSVACEERFG